MRVFGQLYLSPATHPTWPVCTDAMLAKTSSSPPRPIAMFSASSNPISWSSASQNPPSSCQRRSRRASIRCWMCAHSRSSHVSHAGRSVGRSEINAAYRCRSEPERVACSEFTVGAGQLTFFAIARQLFFHSARALLPSSGVMAKLSEADVSTAVSQSPARSSPRTHSGPPCSISGRL